MVPLVDLLILCVAGGAVLVGIVLLAFFSLRLKGLPQLEAAWQKYAWERGYLYRSPTRGLFGWQGSRGPGSPPAILGSIEGVAFLVEAYRCGSAYSTFFLTEPQPLPEPTWVSVTRQPGAGCVSSYGIYWCTSPNLRGLANHPGFECALRLCGGVASFRTSTVYVNLRPGKPECRITSDQWCLDSAALDAMIRASVEMAKLW
jgi:hypothetical protein